VLHAAEPMLNPANVRASSGETQYGWMCRQRHVQSYSFLWSALSEALAAQIRREGRIEPKNRTQLDSRCFYFVWQRGQTSSSLSLRGPHLYPRNTFRIRVLCLGHLVIPGSSSVIAITVRVRGLRRSIRNLRHAARHWLSSLSFTTTFSHIHTLWPRKLGYCLQSVSSKAPTCSAESHWRRACSC